MTDYQTDFEGHEEIHRVPANPDEDCFIYALMDVETRAGQYPIEYLERMKAGVAP